MKAVILAAGMGTRLSSLLPKPLTKLVGEKTIMDFQVEKLSRLVGEHNIMAVVGHKKELIMERFPNLTYAYNQAFAHTNTSKSLLCGLEKLDDDVLWMNGDVYFEEDVVKKMLDSSFSSVLVDTSKCGDEEIKYNLDTAGNIIEISKQVKPGLGEAPGINVVKRHDLKSFTRELRAVGDKEYFEKALENLASLSQIILKPVCLEDLFCKEIDFAEDLDIVKKYINQAQGAMI